MEITIGPPKDLAHRLTQWAHENRSLLIGLLIGGIAFFGLLAGFLRWQGARQEKEAAARWELIEKAQLALESKDWADCIARSEELYRQSTHPLFRVLALHGVGTCQRGSGDFQAAAATFERAAKEPGHLDPKVSEAEAKKSLEMGDEKKNEK